MRTFTNATVLVVAALTLAIGLSGCAARRARALAKLPVVDVVCVRMAGVRDPEQGLLARKTALLPLRQYRSPQNPARGYPKPLWQGTPADGGQSANRPKRAAMALPAMRARPRRGISPSTRSRCVRMSMTAKVGRAGADEQERDYRVRPESAGAGS